MSHLNGSLEREAADAYCRLLTGRHYENFSVASTFVGAQKRLDLMRVYAFCRTTDDLGDENLGSDPLERLSRWRADVAALFEGRQPIHPVLIALRQTVERCSLPVQPFMDLIEANVVDQRVAAYDTWPELEAYCMLSAAPVGRMVLGVFGIADPTADHLSDDVCIGLQLANHAQDVRRDAAIGRTYLLRSDLAAGGTPAGVRGLVERARRLLDSGRALERMAPTALRIQLSLYRLGGLAICDAIERIDFATDRERPRVTGATKMAIAARAAFALAERGGKVRHAEPA
jgi:squalene synthase HpnC